MTASGRRRAQRMPSEVEPSRATPRTGAKRTVMGTISEIPNFLRLLYGLITD